MREADRRREITTYYLGISPDEISSHVAASFDLWESLARYRRELAVGAPWLGVGAVSRPVRPGLDQWALLPRPPGRPPLGAYPLSPGYPPPPAYDRGFDEGMLGVFPHKTPRGPRRRARAGKSSRA